jgi:hypothetical protein
MENSDTRTDVASVAADVRGGVAASVAVALGRLLVLVLGLLLGLSSGSRRSTALNNLLNITGSTVGSTADGTTGDDIGTRDNVVGSGRAPEREVDGRVVLLVDTGDLDRGTRDAGGAVARDLDLGAGVVELGLTTVGTVEGNVLTTDEVLTVGKSRGDLEVDRVLVPRAPRGATELFRATSLADKSLVNLVPVEVGGVGGGSIINLGSVDLDGTRVLHTSTTESLLETDFITSLDLEDVARSGAALVAGEVLVVGGDGTVGDALELGGHVTVLVLADVLVVGTLLLTTDGKLVEGVMGADGGGQAENSGNVAGGLHFDRVVVEEVSDS